jgi:dTDP-4-amino-4,6-dideoxygalactose transaminase
MNIPFFKFECTQSEIEEVTSVLNSGWLTTAKKAAELEDCFKERCLTKYALAVNSCTAGLHLALEAVGIKPGDKVVVPSLTFTASAEVIRYLGADPIFVDVDKDTLLLRKSELESAYKNNPDIKACVVVHFGGQSAEMTGEYGIWDYCKANGIKLVQDAAHAFPAFDDYGPVGSLGDITCFSFYANKTMTTGEGGMVVTNDEDIANRVKTMRLHGINRDIWDRFTSSNSTWEYDVVAPGFKYNMPDVNAAIGLAQLKRVDDFRHKRQRCAEYYLDSLSSLDWLLLPKSRVKLENHAWHLFPIVVKEDANINRDILINCLNEKGIGTSVHYKPLHRMSYYRDRYNLHPENYPNTEKYWKGCLSLPIYPGLSQEALEYIVKVVKNSVD